MINLYPKKCNLCGGKVIYTSNRRIYRKEYGSGKCYYCTECGGYVGTHVPRPREALGILADQEMRELKKRCHVIFDGFWENEKTSRKRHIVRQQCYRTMADLLGLQRNECHFGYFDKETLITAMQILESEKFRAELQAHMDL